MRGVYLLVGGIALLILSSSLGSDATGLTFLGPEDPLHLWVRAGGVLLAVIGLTQMTWPALQSRLGGERAPPGPSVVSRRPPETRKPLSVQAAEAEQRGSWLSAADLHDRAGDLVGAARCYAAARDETTAGGREYGRLLQLATNRLWAADRHDEAVALALSHNDRRLAGELRGRAGDFRGQAALLAQQPSGLQDAAELLAKGGDRMGAAVLLVRGGDLKRAVDLLAGEDPRVAAKLCEQEGHPLLAADLYARAGDLDTAAAVFAQNDAPARAAELYERLGDLPTAAALFETGKEWGEAARVRLELGELEKAGQLFAKAGDAGGLGKALEARGDFMGAARGYFQGGLFQEALTALGSAPAARQQDPKARLLSSAAWLRLGKPDQALSGLKILVKDRSVPTADRTEAYYAMGLAYEAQNEVGQAIAAYDVVSAVDPKYRDTALRLGELRSLQRQAQKDSTQLGAAATSVPRLPERYRMEGKLGEGAMGVVYLATDSVLGRPVAIKVLSADLAGNEKARSYFLREARAAAGLSHPNVVTLYDAGVEGSAPYLVMEFVRGVDLETETLGKPLPEARALRYGLQIAAALDYVNGKGIVHRDVKPANIIRLEGSETVKLMDFGIAYLTEGSGKKSTIVAGTPDFMAPEQLIGRGLGPWTDVYALGGTLFQFLTGQVAYPEGVSDTHVPDPRGLAQVSEETARIVLDCLERDAKARPQTAGVIRDRLAAVLAKLAPRANPA